MKKKEKGNFKPMRYRRDLTENHFRIRHAFRKGFKKLEIQPVYSGSVFPNLVFPLWYRSAPGIYRLLKTEFRDADITVLSNRDVKRICGYIYEQKQSILDVFFDFTALPVLMAEIAGIDGNLIYRAKFEYDGISCYAFQTKQLIKYL